MHVMCRFKCKTSSLKKSFLHVADFLSFLGGILNLPLHDTLYVTLKINARPREIITKEL